jgi:hypothetical protein
VESREIREQHIYPPENAAIGMPPFIPIGSSSMTCKAQICNFVRNLPFLVTVKITRAGINEFGCSLEGTDESRDVQHQQHQQTA